MGTNKKITEIYVNNFAGVCQEQLYVHVSGPSYGYWYKPNLRSYTPIEPRIRASGYQGRIAAPILRSLVKHPLLAQILPSIQLEYLCLPTDEQFDAAIVGRRIKTFHINDGLVYTFLNDSDIDILAEVEVRRQLPEIINVPKIITFDNEVPYFVEEYLPGKTLTNPLKQRNKFFSALEELRPLYETQFEKQINTQTLLSSLQQQLYDCNEIEKTFIKDVYDLIERFELPENVSVSQIHGDFHPENILLIDDDVYLIDWEHSREDLIIADLFLAFEVFFTVEGTTDFIWELINMTGAGGEVASEYATKFGELAFSETEFYSGLPLLAFVNRLAQIKTNKPRQHPIYTLLQRLINEC